MRSMLLIAASMLVASAAGAQVKGVTEGDRAISDQLVRAYEDLSSEQRSIAIDVYIEYARRLRVVRADGTRLQPGDSDIIKIARLGVLCNVSIVDAIRRGTIVNAADAVTAKFVCFKGRLAANPETQGYKVYLTN